MKTYGITLIVGLMVLLAGCSSAAAPTPTPTLPPTPTPTPEWEREGWNLVWHDEFEGETLNPEYWTYDIGGHGWGNNELQAYTDRTENVRLEDGFLVLEARAEKFVRRDYTSGRIKTQGRLAWTYGRFEARMQLPSGVGLWPAFWMLGTDIDTAGWPLCGEIDIMEFVGKDPTHVYGTVHGPGYSGGSGVGTRTSVPDASSAFHVYAVEWEPEEIRWYVDDVEFFRVTPQSVPGTWVYDHPFFILLNLAVGGNWPGPPNETTVFPQQLKVDYVRVYQRPDQIGAGATERGTLHVGDITARIVTNADGTWQAVADILVVDTAGQPVSNAQVVGGWVGAVPRGETEGLTDAEGRLSLRSEASDKSGERTFCVTSITRVGYTYDKEANVRNCAKVTP